MAEIKKLKPVELWILLILKAGGGEVCCKTKIMKILFLLERVYGIIGVKFEPYDYGPWSKDVEDALRRLVELGLVEEVDWLLAGPASPEEEPRKRRRVGWLLALSYPRSIWKVELGLVEERELPKPPELMYVYRLTEKGRSIVEKIPLKDPRWRLPYADVKFFVGWDVRDLMEYIYVNYPEYAVNSVIKDKLARKPAV